MWLLTRANTKLHLTYAQITLPPMGKLTDSEPRFIEEIDGHLEYLTPAESSYRYQSIIDKDILRCGQI
jgi:DNA helicase-2/ATP-dependent DNA helicase PcrA